MRTKDQDVVDALRCVVVRGALCAKITRPSDSFELGFTGHNKPLSISGLEYKPEQSLSPKAFVGRSDLSAANTSVTLLTSDDITEDDLIGGRWDNAVIMYFFVPDWNNLSLATVPLGKFLLGRVTVNEGNFEADALGFGERLNQPVVDLTSITCRNRLGDAICRAPLKPAFWLASTAYTAIVSGAREVGSYVRPTTYTGLDAECTVAGTSGGTEPTWPTTPGDTIGDGTVTWRMYTAWTQQAPVTQVYDKLRFEASGMTQPDDWARYGKITWLTGNNDDLSEDVRYFQSGGAFTLLAEMPRTIAIGDTLEVISGCVRRFQEDCKTKFDNVKNFNGEHFLPGSDEAAQFPNAQ